LVCCFNLATMSRASVVPLALLAGACLAHATLESSSYVTDKCHELLAGVQNEGHSHFEVAALCRARFPSNLCRQGLSRLGRQPWSAETMRSACGSWDAEWQAHAVGPAPARRTQDLVEGMEYTMDKKHELGICTNLDFEACLQYKAAKYPGIVQNITRVIGEITNDASVAGKGTQVEAPPAPGVDTPPAPTEPPAEPVVSEWADFHKTLNFSGQQSHLPWAVAGFAAGIAVGALLVARATSGLRQRHDVIHADGTRCMPAE